MYDRQTGQSLWPRLRARRRSARSPTPTPRSSRSRWGHRRLARLRECRPTGAGVRAGRGLERPDDTNGPSTEYDDAEGDLLSRLAGRPGYKTPVKERAIGLSDGPASVAVGRRSLLGSSPPDATMAASRVALAPAGPGVGTRRRDSRRGAPTSEGWPSAGCWFACVTFHPDRELLEPTTQKASP